jgi:hypothetical protein
MSGPGLVTGGLVTGGLVTGGLVTGGLVTRGLVTRGLVTKGFVAVAGFVIVSGLVTGFVAAAGADRIDMDTAAGGTAICASGSSSSAGVCFPRITMATRSTTRRATVMPVAQRRAWSISY